MRKKILFMTDNIECVGYSLYLLPDTESGHACVNFCSGTAEMEIGIKGEWEQVLENFLHEFGEMYFFASNCIYDSRLHGEEDSVWNCKIIISHEEWQRYNKYLAQKILIVSPRLYTVWSKYNKKEVSKRKGK